MSCRRRTSLSAANPPEPSSRSGFHASTATAERISAARSGTATSLRYRAVAGGPSPASIEARRSASASNVTTTNRPPRPLITCVHSARRLLGGACQNRSVADPPTYGQSEPRPPRATRLGILALVGPLTAFSLMNLIVKVTHLPPPAFAFYRLWLGVLVMFAALMVTGRRSSWADLRRSAPSGVLFGANIALCFTALRLTNIADVLIVAALQPTLTLIVAGRLFGERVETRDWALTSVSLIGVVLVILGSSGSPAWSLRGDLFAVGALFAWTTYWLLSKRVRVDLPAFEYMASVTLVAAVVISPLALLSGQSLHLRPHDALRL